MSAVPRWERRLGHLYSHEWDAVVPDLHRTGRLRRMLQPRKRNKLCENNSPWSHLAVVGSVACRPLARPDTGRVSLLTRSQKA